MDRVFELDSLISANYYQELLNKLLTLKATFERPTEIDTQCCCGRVIVTLEAIGSSDQPFSDVCDSVAEFD